MTTTIKTRDTIVSVKTADHKKNLNHYVKQSVIRSKSLETKDKQQENTNASNHAVDDIHTTWKRSVYEAKYRVFDRKKQIRTSNEIRNNRRLQTTDAPSIETIGHAKEVSRSFKASSKNIKSIKAVGTSVKTGDVASIAKEQANGISYQRQLRSFSIQNHAKRINNIPVTVSNIKVNVQNIFRLGTNIVKSSINGFTTLLSAGSGIILLVILTLFFGVFSSFTNTSVLAKGIELPEATLMPDFENEEAWGENNPYTSLGLMGQCTWFAWGRFYEIYGYDPGFRGDGWNCAYELVAAHPDKFELSYSPASGAIFSTLGHNHVGIVIAVDGDKITIQDGNLDGISNTFLEAMTDWREETYTIGDFITHHGGVIYAVPIISANENLIPSQP